MDEKLNEIVAAVVDDEPTATALAAGLERAGFDASDIDRFRLNQAGQHHGLPLGGDQDADKGAEGGGKGAIKGAAIGTAIGTAAGLAAAPIVGPIAIVGALAAGAYTGALGGAVNSMGEKKPDAAEERPPGIMVAVKTHSADDAPRAIETMRKSGARFIERAKGLWRMGKWSDFDPVAPPRDVVFKEH